ncbi:MAG: glycoside hydrolase family 99-like domain-containing protein [Acidobacteriota bacterium]|nr:glycoside hydrolase family 99-like domain-containing protein [Acidobacteriota bacterium]
MSDENEQQRAEIEELRRRLAETSGLLTSVLGSRSWRLTRPVRRLAELLRGGGPGGGRPEEREGPAAPPAGSPAAPPRPVPAAAGGPEDVLAEAQRRVPLGRADIRLIAFYLPQFHPIPENDRFWGRGFTEWTNTTKAKPLFDGHDQPRLPGELGFYDLRLKEVQRRQVELARQAGIAGFCYHYYWFTGRKVLDLPLRQLLADPSLDFPFCLSWANEAWTAAWDGVSTEGVLIPQRHSPEDDLAFLAAIEPALTDPRYIRVHGKPLLSIYRPGLFPDMRATADRWRERALASGIGELYLALVHNVDDALVDPREHGFDAAIEFPPACLECVDVRDRVQPYEPGYPENIYSYPALVQCALDRPAPDYTLLRGIMPGWDNTARRKDGTLYLGSTPALYRSWLEGLCRYTRRHLPPGERLIFINAWNEWAEGAYLEPDRKHGYAYLNHTALAVARFNSPRAIRRLLLLGHDAARAGSQILLLDLARWIATRTSTEVLVALGAGGELLEAYAELADVLVLEDLARAGASASEVPWRLREWAGDGIDLIYANTAVAGRYLPLLASFEAPVVTHVHELEESLRLFAGTEAIQNVVFRSERLIAASPAVAANLVENHGVAPDAVDAIHAFIRPRNAALDPGDRALIRERMGVGPDEVLVFGCGTRDWRKGPDLFVDVAAALRDRGRAGFRFVWIGPEMRGHYPNLESGLAARGLDAYVRFHGPVADPTELFAAGDVFLLPSREDPFPLVCLEAASCELPTVCFADVGGMPEFVEGDAGIVVPNGDLGAMTDAVERLIADPGERRARGATARRKLLRRHTTDLAAPEIFHVIRSVSGSPPLVSVVIPNYNYAHRLEGRLESIFGQTFQDFEIILEDDGSTDGSLEVLKRYASRRSLRVFAHASNRGVFEMWRRGIEEAAGELIWVAEADDLCEPDFLETLVGHFEDPEVRLAYCQSIVIDDDDEVLGDYTLAFPGLSSTKWLTPYQQSLERELADGLAVENFLVNASSVVFRKPDPEALAGFPGDFQLAGDWYLYLRLMRGGEIAYSPRKLNRHRRHEGSVIAAVDAERAVAEIGRIHAYVLGEHGPDHGLAERMARYALAVWSRTRSETELDEFWRCYGVSSPRSAREERA